MPVTVDPDVISGPTVRARFVFYQPRQLRRFFRLRVHFHAAFPQRLPVSALRRRRGADFGVPAKHRDEAAVVVNGADVDFVGVETAERVRFENPQIADDAIPRFRMDAGDVFAVRRVLRAEFREPVTDADDSRTAALDPVARETREERVERQQQAVTEPVIAADYGDGVREVGFVDFGFRLDAVDRLDFVDRGEVVLVEVLAILVRREAHENPDAVPREIAFLAGELPPVDAAGLARDGVGVAVHEEVAAFAERAGAAINVLRFRRHHERL